VQEITLASMIYDPGATGDSWKIEQARFDNEDNAWKEMTIYPWLREKTRSDRYTSI